MAPNRYVGGGDAARLAQVVANLFTNAAKYTEKSGRIVIAAGREGTEVVIKVRDSGIAAWCCCTEAASPLTAQPREALPIQSELPRRLPQSATQILVTDPKGGLLAEV